MEKARCWIRPFMRRKCGGYACLLSSRYIVCFNFVIWLEAFSLDIWQQLQGPWRPYAQSFLIRYMTTIALIFANFSNIWPLSTNKLYSKISLAGWCLLCSIPGSAPVHGTFFYMCHLSTLDSIHVPPPKDSNLSSKTARSWCYLCHLSVQFHYAVFFAYIRLREQEIRNLMWISECVAQNQKNRVHDSVVFIFWAPQNNIYGCTKSACFDDGRIACSHNKPRTYAHCPFTRRKNKIWSTCIVCFL
jgi:hypothetical protein